jgi:PAS domain S-box-containing protein
MKGSISAGQLGLRSRVTVLVVMAVAVAMLGLLVVETSRHGESADLMNEAGRQRTQSERLVALTLQTRAAPSEQREALRQRMASMVSEWRDASMLLRFVAETGAGVPAVASAARKFDSLLVVEDSVVQAAQRAAAEGAGPETVHALLSFQQRFATGMGDVIDELEQGWSSQVERLIKLETACVILLLIALGLGVRLALQPTQAQLTATIGALAESESRTRAVLDAMQEGMLLINSTGHIIGWNPSALRILGVSDDAPAERLRVISTELRNEQGELVAPDQLPSRVTIRTGEPVVDRLLATTNERGETRWLNASTSPLYRVEGGDPHAAVTIIRDITTARRLAEERLAQAQALETQNQELLKQAHALEREHALFSALVETAGSAIVGLDAEGKVFEWNRESEGLFGVSRANAIGRNYAEEFVTPEHRDRMRAGIATVLAGKSIRNLLGPVKSANEERHVVLWNITPLRTGIGAPMHGIIASGLDVTEREASDERFRMLFERSSDAHMLYDAGGIIDCNDATLRMLRLSSREQLVGRRPADLSPLRQPDGRLSVVVAGQMRERARITGHHRFEWRHRRDDGSEFPVEVTLTPLRMQGRDVILGVWHDIAERKAVEDALRLAKDAAEAANQTKSEFMTRMNHELRTPLTAIIGFSKVMLDGRAGELSTGAKIYGQRIRENGLHLLSLINQILDVAKVEAGKMELEYEVVLVDTLVNETLGMLESTADAKGISLRREIPDSVLPLVTDPGKLRQILINLIGNAIKFTAEGEVLVRVTTDATGAAREIMVRDTGIGIPVDRQKKIFEPFEQGDSSMRREFGGTGLGLSIVKTFAELIGATVEVESEVGLGTSFSIRLPTPGDRPFSIPPASDLTGRPIEERT